MFTLRLAGLSVVVALLIGVGATSAQYASVTTSVECDILETLQTDGSTIVQAKVVDSQTGDPVPNFRVDFEVITGQANFNPPIVFTDVNGIASTTLTAGGTPGDLEIVCGEVELVSEVLGTSSFQPPTVGSAGLAAR